MDSTAETYFKKAGTVITKCKKTIHDEYKCLKFPPGDYRNITKSKHCKKGKIQLQEVQIIRKNVMKHMLHCNSCNLLLLNELVKPCFSAMLYFEDERVVINIYGDKVDQLLQLTNASNIESEQELALELLTTDNIKVYYNHRFNCAAVSEVS